VRKNLVEYRLPSYRFLRDSSEFIDRGLPDDYSSFSVTKLPIKKPGRNGKAIIIDVLENSQDQSTLDDIKYLKSQPTLTGEGTLNIENEPDRTLQEYTFAKILSLSFEDITPAGAAAGGGNDSAAPWDPSKQEFGGSAAVGGASNAGVIRGDIEKQFADLFPFVLANKQNEIIKECLNSRFFSAFNLDKLITSPLSQEAMGALPCSDYPNINLDNLRKGLLDFDDIKKEVKDLYDDLACETHTRPADEADPLDDAIRYGMILISIRLIIAETVFKSLFFFSRFNAEEAIVNSGVFLSHVLIRLKEQADNSKANPRFYAEIKKIAFKKLLNLVKGQNRVDLLSNRIIFDTNPDPAARQFTNFSNKIFNLADLGELVMATRKTGAEQQSTVADTLFQNYMDTMSDEEEDLSVDIDFSDPAAVFAPIMIKFQTKFNDLAIKNMINDTTKKMASKINSMFLDKDRINVDTTKTLLSSNIIFDIPSDLVNANAGASKQGFWDASSFHNRLQVKVNEDTLLSKAGVPYHEQHARKDLLNEYAGPAPTLSPGENDPLYIPNKAPIRRSVAVIDYTEENARRVALATTNIRNICLDAYATDTTFYANTMQSTFYNREGNLTKLGKATRNGGFIVQKYVQVKLKKDPGSFEGDKKRFLDTFRSAITGTTNLDWENPEYIFNLSYKQFDFILSLALTSASPLADAPFIIPGTGDIFTLSEVFDYIRQEIRLVYVMPHSINVLATPGQGIAPEEFEKYAVEYEGRLVAPGSIPAYSNTVLPGQIEDLLLETEGASPGSLNQIFSRKTYQIKEPIPKDFDNLNTVIEGAEDLLFSKQEKTIGSFYVIPIKDAYVTRDLSMLEEMTNVKAYLALHPEVRHTGNDFPPVPLFSSEQIAFNDPIVELVGESAQNLMPELFKKSKVKMLNDYVLSSTNLLNFAILQQSYFPYNKKFDFDDLFAGSRTTAEQIFNESSKPKDDWSSLLTDEVLSGWNNEMDKIMSAQIPEGAFFQWLLEVIPKWILRWYVAAIDPCMKEAFDQQDENDWDDKMLPEIVFGSLLIMPEHCSREFDEIVKSIPGLELALDLLGISVPGDTSETKLCLPGIRPVPIIPVGFPLFGDSMKPITAPGLIYTLLQFLVGYDEKFNPESLPEINVDVDTPKTDICGPDSNLNQNSGLITQETSEE
jgi:hypothetical protein